MKKRVSKDKLFIIEIRIDKKRLSLDKIEKLIAKKIHEERLRIEVSKGE